jgi:hypothetical protein
LVAPVAGESDEDVLCLHKTKLAKKIDCRFAPISVEITSKKC